jgi:hypothetical protein
MFYRKVKKFCFVVDFFIWIIIKYSWCDIKSVKKLKCFDLIFLKEVKRNRGKMTMDCQTSPKVSESTKPNQTPYSCILFINSIQRSSIFKFLNNKTWNHLMNPTQNKSQRLSLREEIIYCIRLLDKSQWISQSQRNQLMYSSVETQ